MNLSDLVYILGSNLHTLPDAHPVATFAAYVGEPITFAFTTPLAARAGDASVDFAPVVTVTRQPPGSALAFTGGSATPAVPGAYTVTVQNGNLPARTVRFVAFPASALTAAAIKEPKRQVLPERIVPDPTPLPESTVRAALTSLVRELGRSGDLASFDAMTAAAPIPPGIDWRDYVR